MTRIVAPIRGRKAAKRPDISDLRALLKDGRCECQMGVVRNAELGGKHWELTDDGDILVEVTTAPRGLELSCRLASSAGSAGMGLWRVPAIGDEVLVLVPEGEIDFQPAIVAVLSSGGVPDRVSDTRTILVATDEVEIIAPLVKLGPDPDSFDAQQMGALNGQAIDPYTGLTHAQLGNASTAVLLKKA